MKCLNKKRIIIFFLFLVLMFTRIYIIYSLHLLHYWNEAHVNYLYIMFLASFIFTKKCKRTYNIYQLNKSFLTKIFLQGMKLPHITQAFTIMFLPYLVMVKLASIVWNTCGPHTLREREKDKSLFAFIKLSKQICGQTHNSHDKSHNLLGYCKMKQCKNGLKL